MAIKIYSDKTNKYYNSIQDAERAEFELKAQENREKILADRKIEEIKAQKEKEVAERKADAAKVDTARKAMVEAQNAYRKELEAFCKRWGSYHYTSKSINDIPTLFADFWNWFV